MTISLKILRLWARVARSLYQSDPTTKTQHMPAQVLADLTREVEEMTTVAESAAALINGFKERTQAAVDKALQNGATAAELAPVTELVKSLDTQGTKLADAVKANTDAENEEPPAEEPTTGEEPA